MKQRSPFLGVVENGRRSDDARKTGYLKCYSAVPLHLSTPSLKGPLLIARSALTGVSRKLLLSIAAIGAAAAIAGLGTYATFTSSTSASQSVASGTVTIALGATGASTNRLTVGASNIAAGDTIQRSVDLINQGSIDLASITLTTSATASSLLDSDATNGLQMVIDKCSVPWTEGGT